MSVNDRKVFVMALALVALMSIFVPVASAESQDWYLHNDLTLDKTGPGTGTKNVPVGTDSTAWTAGPAQCGLTIGAGTWTQSLDYAATSAGTLYMGVYKEEGNILVGFGSRIILSGTHSITPLEITGISVDFYTGQHLQSRMQWVPDSGTSALVVTCESGTKLTSPSTDPGYPVPELSSLILFSVGLLALAGYVVYKKKR